MLYARNVPKWERAMRVVAGLTMIVFGLLGLAGQALGWLIAGAGVVAMLTGFVGFCPMCAVAGRKLPEQ